MKKTYMVPTVKVTAFTESFSLCAATTINVSNDAQDASLFGAKNGNAYFDDEEEEEDY